MTFSPIIWHSAVLFFIMYYQLLLLLENILIIFRQYIQNATVVYNKWKYKLYHDNVYYMFFHYFPWRRAAITFINELFKHYKNFIIQNIHTERHWGIIFTQKYWPSYSLWVSSDDYTINHSFSSIQLLVRKGKNKTGMANSINGQHLEKSKLSRKLVLHL